MGNENRKRLTDDRIRNFRCDDGLKQDFMFDTECRRLAVRATANGVLSFVFEAKVNRKTFRRTLGDATLMSLDDAREEARRLQRMTDKGIDPREAEREEAAQMAAQQAAAEATARAEKAEEEAKAKYTLRGLCESYQRYLAARGKARSAAAVKSVFEVHVYPKDIASKVAREVTSREGAELVRAVQEAGKVRTAGILRSYLHAAYSIARKAPLSAALPSELIPFDIDSNPMEAVPAIPVATRSRTLSPKELQTYLSNLGETLPDQALLLALLAGGQRLAQLLRAKVSDWDASSATLRLFDPKGKRQTPREHLIPLATRGATLTEKLAKRAKKAEAVQLFDVGAGAVLAFETAGKRVSEISKTMAGEPFDARDLRRTVESMLAALKVDRETRAQLLSHGLSGVQVARYDRHAYTDEKRAALETWEARLTDIEKGKFELPKTTNVVQLPAKRARKKK